MMAHLSAVPNVSVHSVGKEVEHGHEEEAWHQNDTEDHEPRKAGYPEPSCTHSGQSRLGLQESSPVAGLSTMVHSQ